MVLFLAYLMPIMSFHSASCFNLNALVKKDTYPPLSASTTISPLSHYAFRVNVNPANYEQKNRPPEGRPMGRHYCRQGLGMNMGILELKVT